MYITTYAQDIQFSRVQEAVLLSNPSGYLSKNNNASIMHRNIQTQDMQSYSSMAGLANIYFNPKKNDSCLNSSYFNFSVGLTNENAMSGTFKTNAAIIGLGYNLSLNNKGLYLGLAFQTQFNNSSINFSGQILPKQLDAFGINSAIAPTDIIYNKGAIQWMTVHTGFTLTNKTEHSNWFIGVGMRHLNKPTIAWQENTSNYSLPMSITTQVGSSYHNSQKSFGWYVFTARRASATEIVLGAFAEQKLNFISGSFKFGLGYRKNDGLIPSLEIRWNSTKLGLSYDIGQSNSSSSYINKHALELGISIGVK
jgi:hypothetical protein